ncbi:MAG: sodium ion-translocating decarboxylase subunit beta [Oscillospiraceae bacterium]|nr:sodium ion-translocating decarboxylase subunit beta [Oscillospiraceae bacterium]
MADLSGSIQERREAGQTDQEIMAELGDPKKAAAELNEQMKEYAYRKSPWRFGCLAVSCLSAGWLIWYWGIMSLLTGFTIRESGSLGIIGGADGPTAIFVSTAIPNGIDWDIVLMVGLFLVGIAGYFLLCRRPGK